MADNHHAPAHVVEGGEELPAGRWKVFLASVQQVMGAAVPFGMEIALLALESHESGSKKVLQTAVPWVTLLSVASVCIKYKTRCVVKNKKGFWHRPTIPEVFSMLFALLLFSFSFVAWLKAVHGKRHGDIWTLYPAAFSTLFLIFSVIELCQSANP